jgi:hypothetical protein
LDKVSVRRLTACFDSVSVDQSPTRKTSMSNKAKQTPSQAPSPETVAEAMRIAKSTQRPEQTKAQTKLIAQGIQKGIDQYKKTYKERRRELDKQGKKVKAKADAAEEEYSAAVTELEPAKASKLPWILLAASWIGFVGFQLATPTL